MPTTEYGLREKPLCGIPWRILLALIDYGWIPRQEIIWSKTRSIPDNAEDRPARTHETIFMFTREGRYFYDGRVIAEPAANSGLRPARSV